MNKSTTITRKLTFTCRIFIFAFVLIGCTHAQTVQDGSVRGQDVTLHYKIHGVKGDYVILLAGGPGSDVRYMQPLADALSDSYRCVMLEQRGTGRSRLDNISVETVKMERYVEDIELVRKNLKASKISLIGNSWGSMLGLLYSGAYPNRVSKLISVGSGPINDKYADIFDDNLRVRHAPEAKKLRDEWREKLRNDPTLFDVARFERDKLGVPAYYYDREIGLKAASDLRPNDANYRLGDVFGQAYPKFDIRPSIRKIKAATLLIQGRQDPAPESSIVETHQLIKGSILKFIERCGHIPWEEKPTETFQLIRTHLLKKVNSYR